MTKENKGKIERCGVEYTQWGNDRKASYELV